MRIIKLSYEELLKLYPKQPIRAMEDVMCLVCIQMNRNLHTGTDPDLDTDEEGFMHLSTDDIEDAFMPIEWPIGTEPPSDDCECMVPEVAIYVGLNKQVEYCKSCGKDMPNQGKA